MSVWVNRAVSTVCQTLPVCPDQRTSTDLRDCSGFLPSDIPALGLVWKSAHEGPDNSLTSLVLVATVSIGRSSCRQRSRRVTQGH
jgi:hypothetical protein